jgi:hypothetical protein
MSSLNIDSDLQSEGTGRNPKEGGLIYRIAAGPPQGFGAFRARGSAAPLPRPNGMRVRKVFSP